MRSSAACRSLSPALPSLLASLFILAPAAEGQHVRNREHEKRQSRPEIEIHVGRVPTLNASFQPTGSGSLLGSPADGGTCPQEISSHTDADFTGGAFVIQAGFAEHETAAASYTLSAEKFPIQLDMAEMIFATEGATEQTTTKWSFLVWEGTPQTGTLIFEFSSDDILLPHIVLPPGTNGVNVQVSVDPGDPDQIVITDNGSHTFSIGYRIDEHHNQVGSGCSSGDIPTCCNAFPTTDTSGVAQPSKNWIDAIDCGPGSCVPGGGWSTFAALPCFPPLFCCQPSGDWVMRARWHSLSCVPGAGACCLPDGTCQILLEDDCLSDDGVYQGDDVLCIDVSCPEALGACCFAGSCADSVNEGDCTDVGGIWMGPESTCASVECDPDAACCIPSTGGCLNLTASECAVASGIWQGPEVMCGEIVCFPEGACCLPDGSCAEAMTPEECDAERGVFQGDGTSCGSVECPEPEGACCLPGGCLTLTEGDCAVAGGTWQGATSECASACSCPEDLDQDGSVGFTDLLAILNAWGPCPGCEEDLDADGNVGFTDLLAILNAWGDC